MRPFIPFNAYEEKRVPRPKPPSRTWVAEPGDEVGKFGHLWYHVTSPDGIEVDVVARNVTRAVQRAKEKLSEQKNVDK